MRPHYSIHVQPTSEPISYDEAAEHLRVDSQADMEYISALIPVAREMVDAVTGRASMMATYKMVAPSWAILAQLKQLPIIGNLDVPIYRTPLASISSVKYYNDANVLTTMSSGDYFAVTITEPGRLVITGDLPGLFDRPDAIVVEFIAGHTTAGAVWAMHKHAIKMLVHHLYEERATVSPTDLKEIPWSLSAIINQIKVGGWCA